MKLDLTIDLCTDGDFWVRNANELFDKSQPLYKKAKISYHCYSTDENIYFELHAEGDAYHCQYAARDLIQNLVVSLDVGALHYWLVKDLYEMLIGVKEKALFKGESGTWGGCMCGNYDGTNITLTIKV